MHWPLRCGADQTTAVDGAGPWPSTEAQWTVGTLTVCAVADDSNLAWRVHSVGGAVRLFLAHLEFPLDLLRNLPKCHYRSSRRLYPLASAWGVDLATITC